MNKTTTPTWASSIKRAQTAMRKTFDGRMEVAAASYDQIPPQGKGATHAYTLADFADEAGIELSTLKTYRSVYTWLGDGAHLGTISYSTVREAMDSGEWPNGTAFFKFIEQYDPPIWESEGYEPLQFKTWTLDALRVYLGDEPTNTAKANRAARAEGRVLTDAEIGAAAAADLAVPSPAQVVEALRSNPEVAKAVVAHDDAMEAVQVAREDRASARLGGYREQEAERGSRIQNERAQDARSRDDDIALNLLRSIAHDWAEAILCKEQWGVFNTEYETELLERIDRLRAAYSANVSDLTAEDLAWAEANGVKL